MPLNKNGHPIKKLKDLIRLDRGGSPRPISKFLTNSNDGVNWIKIGDTKGETLFINSTAEKITPEGAKKSRRVNKGEIVLSCSMSYGKPFILNIDGCIHDGWLAIRDYEESFDKTYLLLYLGSEIVKNQYKRLAAGGVVSNIKSELVYSVEVAVPPLEEQRRIAGILSTWEKAINAYDRLIALKENQKHGVAQIMFSNVIDEVSFADVIDVTIGGTPSRANDLYWDKDKSTDNRWISIANMNSSFISDSTEYISDEGVKKSNVKLLPEGTVIFSFKLSLGKKAILEKACYTNEAIAGLVIKDDASLSRDYLFHALDFVDVNREIDQAVKGKTLNKAKLLRLKLPIMPLEEQQKVARVLNCAQKEIALLERKRDLLIKQKQGLMQQLLA